MKEGLPKPEPTQQERLIYSTVAPRPKEGVIYITRNFKVGDAWVHSYETTVFEGGINQDITSF